VVEDTKDRISALMDGELDAGELETALAALRREGEALNAWRTYHLIGDALQGRALLDSACASRVLARLAQEPALLGTLPAGVVAPARQRWFVPSALAAGVAAVALVGWMAFAPRQSTTVGVGEVARAPAPAVAMPAGPAPQPPARAPLTAAARDYLLAHQAFSPRNSLQGVAPYVRSVAAEAPAKP
jgi:sigma-E factor negative regulatory protein RseA